MEHQVGDFPENWASESINIKNLAPYIYPNETELKNFKVEALYFSYFLNGAC